MQIRQQGHAHKSASVGYYDHIVACNYFLLAAAIARIVYTNEGEAYEQYRDYVRQSPHHQRETHRMVHQDY